jgi:hypothetical protein
MHSLTGTIAELFRMRDCGRLSGAGWRHACVVDAGSLWELARSVPEL